jgi:hypothetical protein
MSDLSSYLGAALETEQAALKEHKDIISYLEVLETLFVKLVSGKSHTTDPVVGLLAMNAHASFLAAISTAFRGQTPPTFMILRGCLESSLYAYLVSVDEKDGYIWLNREKDPKAAKEKFYANRAIEKLELLDPNLAALAKENYQWTIEFGAHPNHRAVLDHVRIKQGQPTGHEFSLVYLNAEASLATIRALAACVETGGMVLSIICHAMPDHPEGNAAFDEVWRLLRAFQKHLAETGRLPREV